MIKRLVAKIEKIYPSPAGEPFLEEVSEREESGAAGFARVRLSLGALRGLARDIRECRGGMAPSGAFKHAATGCGAR